MRTFAFAQFFASTFIRSARVSSFCTTDSRSIATSTIRKQIGFGIRHSTTGLEMVKNRGLEIPEEGATPLPGGMTLYLKAGPDGTSVGDCPFAHYVRIVLNEKGLEYDLKPCTQDTKPQWLIDYYDGSMPALRHRKECYVESDIIAQYLDFFFQDSPLSGKKRLVAKAQEAADGLFPAIAKYLKHTPDGDEDDEKLRLQLIEALNRLEDHLAGDSEIVRSGPFFVGSGDDFTLVDASLAPKLFHMQTGLKKFKADSINLSADFPALRKYMDTLFARKSFVDAIYPEETVVWGWSNARNQS
mmetsp:Transcript_28502/g.62040  ORF Transcript_28502/g.62040 Transcript_28502/m.62040 type:complete len:300 (-) Transcript_28502:292-1191(-)